VIPNRHARDGLRVAQRVRCAPHTLQRCLRSFRLGHGSRGAANGASMRDYESKRGKKRLTECAVILSWRPLIDGAAFGPDALKAVYDAAWAEIADNFGDDTVQVEALRLRLRCAGAENSHAQANGARLRQTVTADCAALRAWLVNCLECRRLTGAPC
jgi:hypothetical protein